MLSPLGEIPPLLTLLPLYLVFINLVASIFFFLDKYYSRHNKRRIPEKWLLIFCALGGSLGGMVAMKLLRHKTRKGSFLLPFWGIVLLQILFVFVIVKGV